MISEGPPDLFQIGQESFRAFLAEAAAYGIQADPGIELRRGSGLLCYYSLEDRHIYLAVPDPSTPVGRLHAVLMRSILGLDDTDQLMELLRHCVPFIIAHELAHHYRHRYGLFGPDPWREEQIANRLAVAMVKHRLPPHEKSRIRTLLRRALETMGSTAGAQEVAFDSYYDSLHALNISGRIGTHEFETLELIQRTLDTQAEELLRAAGTLGEDAVTRLEKRAGLIAQINREYASDQLKYMYYHVGWLYLDLTSRETEYVDEFARLHLNLSADLLPPVPAPAAPGDDTVLACFRAFQDTQPRSAAAGRYFYKRYRSALLARIGTTTLPVMAQADRLRREARLVLEGWQEGHTDTLDYLAHLAPAELSTLFPHRIQGRLNPLMEVAANLPAETDRRLWAHVAHGAGDSAAAQTLYRLEMLDRSEVYRPLPAEVMMDIVHRLSHVRYAPGEAVIWEGERNDDVYVLLEGRLEVLATQGGRLRQIGVIHPGEMFGEIAFFTEDARYATVRALEHSRCFVLTDVDLQLLAYEHPLILMQMAGALAQRLADLYKTSRNETV